MLILVNWRQIWETIFAYLTNSHLRRNTKTDIIQNTKNDEMLCLYLMEIFIVSPFYSQVVNDYSFENLRFQSVFLAFREKIIFFKLYIIFYSLFIKFILYIYSEKFCTNLWESYNTVWFGKHLLHTFSDNSAPSK